ncbi:unnamed protein product [Schistosoma curassoni]|nr:unnamed protein product [Schistosoma curassoni]
MRKKMNQLNDLTMTAEKAASDGNMRQLYDTTKKLAGNSRKPERPVKSKEGKVITNIEEQRNRWVEHFKELMKQPAPLNPPKIEAAPTDLPIDVGPPTIEEINLAIRQIKSGKAAGPENIPAEALKADVAVTARILHILFNKIWDEERVPTDWKEGLLIKVPKKGDLSKCDNYRGITLLSIPGKVFNRVLLNMMKESVDPNFETNRQDSVSIDHVQTKSQHYGSLWNNQLNGIHHSTSTSLTTRKHLTLWIGQHYGVFFNTTACLRK